MTTPDAKPCALTTCGDTIVRPPRMSQQEWDLRRYCNRRCQAAANRLRYPAPTDTKPCGHCDTVMTRRREDGPTKWEEKLYCSRDCALAARRANMTTPPPTPAPAASPTPGAGPTPPAPPAPAVWRPTGWTATPNTGRAS